MKEHVFSTLLILQSTRGGESVLDFYARVRRRLYAYLVEHFPQVDSKGKSFSDALTEESFMFEDKEMTVVVPFSRELCSLQETALDGKRAFVLSMSEPRLNKWYKVASDHSLCTEVIVKTFSIENVIDVAVQMSVRVWVEYQPFAGFFKTRKLPRHIPPVAEFLVGMDDVEMVFAPRFVSKHEAEKNPSLQKGPRLFYPVRREWKKVSDGKGLDDFKGHLLDPTRPIPIVIFFGDSWRNRREASFVAESCWAKCRVWILKKGVSGLEELLQQAIEGIDVRKNFRRGYCRILFPAGKYCQEDFAQPYYRVPYFLWHHFRKRIRIGLLRFYRLDGRGWLENERELQLAKYQLQMSTQLLESSENEKTQKKIFEQLIVERKDLRDRLNFAENDLLRVRNDLAETQKALGKSSNYLSAMNAINKQLQAERDYARSLLDSKKAKLNSAKENIVSLQQSNDEMLDERIMAESQLEERDGRILLLQQRLQELQGNNVPQVKNEKVGIIGNFVQDDAPDSFEALTWVAPRIFRYLAFSAKCWDRMERKKDKAKHVHEVWRMLWSLDALLAPMLFDLQRYGDVAQRFFEKTHYLYAPKDSSDLPKKMDRERDFEFEGKPWRMEPHIKNGNRDATLIRIYFAIDYSFPGGRLIIGSIGDHLTTLDS